jgi:hypothetical protein
MRIRKKAADVKKIKAGLKGKVCRLNIKKFPVTEVEGIALDSAASAALASPCD